MRIDEYKTGILLQLEKAIDCEEVVQIIDLSADLLRNKNIHAKRITNYLKQLQQGLEGFSQRDFGPVHWFNIQCAVRHLRKITSN